jgi:hypothetical protein
MENFKLEGTLILPKTNGVEIKPEIFLIGEPTPRPDLGKTSLACLANVHGMLCTVELTIKFKENEMSTDYIDRSNDEEIIDIVCSVMDNGTGKAETVNEHILIKLMQLRGTPMLSFKFDQERVDFHYNNWVAGGN